MDTEPANIHSLLRVEDDPRGVELTLTAREEYHPARKAGLGKAVDP